MNCKLNQIPYAAFLNPTLYWKRFCVCYPCWEVRSWLLDKLHDCSIPAHNNSVVDFLVSIIRIGILAIKILLWIIEYCSVSC